MLMAPQTYAIDVSSANSGLILSGSLRWEVAIISQFDHSARERKPTCIFGHAPSNLRSWATGAIRSRTAITQATIRAH